MDSALKLASFCSQETPETLESAYRNLCQSDGEFCDPEDAPPEPDEEEDAAAHNQPHAEQECADFLLQLPVQAQLLAEDDQDEAMEEIDSLRHALKSLPDAEQLKKLIEKENVMEPFKRDNSKSPNTKVDPNYLPSTLAEALDMKCDQWNSLWRLAVRLRAGYGGMDTMFIKNPRSVRRASKGLSWYQPLVFICFLSFFS